MTLARNAGAGTAQDTGTEIGHCLAAMVGCSLTRRTNSVAVLGGWLS
jgi:hypothetical protein